ncbi:hypothetical protein [Persicitalea jodogahamensis]|uniref:Sialate O-acetylesterase domain-containing protein n=1 Tax=Persicitalea jodogahamensis TaxID=402147 RepID=A0A8J3D5R9_9BACT|nr:hypothetical protein [Persicitalea jodogahamensis]GHB56919.1 hypothetical protein GCM10007390_07910 [Persicitalea jodogahamensis]
MVLQRDNAGQTNVFVRGQCPADLDRVEARLVARTAGQGTTTTWQTVEETPISGFYSGTVAGAGGWYDLQVRGVLNGQPAATVTTLLRIGIGEVFLIVGHSNAQGGASPSLGSQDDRVSSAQFLNKQQWNDYDRTADVAYLPFKYGHLNDTIAPFHNIPWFWGQLGDSLANRLNVPILFYGAAFGGSNMLQTYNAAYNIPFTHGFIKYSIRMPYVNIRNTLTHYAPVTGLRGILSGHGVNDGGSSTAEFKFHSEQVVAKTREEANLSNFPWMVARSAWNNGPINHILAAQNVLISQDPQTYEGPSLNQIENWGRTDNLHFNEIGQVEAARLWANAIVGSPFLSQTTFITPKPQADGLPPVSLLSGTWGTTASWRNANSPQPIQKVYIKTPHTIEISTPQTAKSLFLSGNINFTGNGQLQLTGN